MHAGNRNHKATILYKDRSGGAKGTGEATEDDGGTGELIEEVTPTHPGMLITVA